MKRLIIIFIFSHCSLVLLAQSSALNSAIFAQRDGDIDVAYSFIEQAVVHEKTRSLPKTWYTRGLIFEDIHKATNPKYKSLSPVADSMAVACYFKTLELDSIKKGEYYTNAANRMPQFWGVLLNEGVGFYNSNDFAKAIRSYELAASLRPADTTAYLYALYSSSAGNMVDETYRISQKLISIGYESPRIYLMMIQYQRSIKNDTALAKEWVEKAYRRFPTDKGVMIEKLNLLLLAGDIDKAIEELDRAITNFPEDPVLYFNRGVMFEKKKMKEQAIADYQKGIDVDPKNFDCLYNLGALHFNEGVQYRNELNSLPRNPDPVKKKQLEDNMKKSFSSCIPFFTRAKEIRPTDSGLEINLNAAAEFSK